MSVERNQPLGNIRDETRRVADALDTSGIPLRLIGGAAIWLRCPSAEQPALRRDYADLDFLGLKANTGDIKRFFENLGYQSDKYFNSLHGRTRMLFWDTNNDRQVDVFLDEMRMCHTLNFRSRVSVDPRTLSIADLLLTKLQIVELNLKDINDIIALLIDHPIDEQDGDAINGRYISRLVADDWGLYRTIRQSLERIREAVAEMPAMGKFRLEEQVKQLWGMIEAEPKSVKWVMRSKIGDRVRWYELPEEVRRD